MEWGHNGSLQTNDIKTNVQIKLTYADLKLQQFSICSKKQFCPHEACFFN